MEEIVKLKQILDVLNIDYYEESLFGGSKVSIYNEEGEYLDDAVYNRFSHGAMDGLLETYNLHDCKGYETAIDIAYGWYHKYFCKD